MLGQELKIIWDDAEYTVRPTMRLITQIENDINVFKLFNEMSAGGIPKMSHISVLVAHVLRAAGCERTSEDVWNAICTDKDVEGVVQLAATILVSLFPSIGSGEESPKLQATRKKSTRGKASTK